MHKKFFAVIIFLFLMSSLSWAETFTVTTTNADGTGSLAAAVNGVNSSQSTENYINFDSSIKSLTLPKELTLNSNVIIDGDGVSLTAASGTRLFTVTAGTVLFDSITFKGGKVIADDGGAVKVTGPDSNVEFTNCTFYNNESENFGGAVCATNGTTRLIFCTIAGNIADNGALAVRNGTMNIFASIIVGNTSSNDIYKADSANLTGDDNIIGTSNYNFGSNNLSGQKLSDVLLTNSYGLPLLETVDDIEIIKLTGTSPARDFVNPSNNYGVDYDEIGTSRPQLNYSDSGAYEALPVAVESIIINHYPYMQVSTTEKISIDIYPLDSSLNTRDYPPSGVEWKSDNESIIEIDSEGQAHAAGTGSTYITATVHGWDSNGREMSKISNAIYITVGTEARRPLKASITPIDDLIIYTEQTRILTPEVIIDMNDIIFEDADYSLNVSSSANNIVTAEIISGDSIRLTAGQELGESVITVEARPFPAGDATNISFTVSVNQQVYMYHSGGGGGCNAGISGVLILAPLCAYFIKRERSRKNESL